MESQTILRRLCVKAEPRIRTTVRTVRHEETIGGPEKTALANHSSVEYIFASKVEVDATFPREVKLENRRSPVAQLVEQVAVNHPVAGSSPAGGALLPQASHSAC